jgi:hypothetical protein
VRAWPLELVNGAPLDPKLISEEVDALREQLAPDLFGGFDRSKFPTTSVPALALTGEAYAIRAELGEQIALRVRSALFEEGRDIGSVDVLVDIAHSVGMAFPDDLEHHRVLEDLREGRERGVIGSPHFFVDGRSFFCPALTIRHDEGGFKVAFDREGFDEFTEAAFGTLPALSP